MASITTATIAVLALASLAGAEFGGYALIAMAGLACGAILSLTTPVGRAFRVISSWAAALVTLIVLAMLMGFLAFAGGAAIVLLWTITFFVGGLDLCYVPRARALAMVSGIGLLPLVVASPTRALVWVVGWFVALLVTLWLLNTDVLRAIGRPEPVTPGNDEPPRSPVDLARVLGICLALGLTLAMLVGNPGCSFQPLADLAKHLPWRPKVDGQMKLGRGIPVYDFEVDAHGRETRYSLDGKGRRYVTPPVGPSYERELAVIEQDGVDRFVDSADNVVATYADDGSTLRFSDVGRGAQPLTIHRDDAGWYVDAGEARYRFSYNAERGSVEITAPDGSTVDGPGGEPVYLSDLPGFADLAKRHAHLIQMPNASIIFATSGIDPTVVRKGNTVTTRDHLVPGSRTYHLGKRLQVDVDLGPQGRYHYEFNEKRSRIKVFRPDGTWIGVAKINRQGNYFDRDKPPLNPDKPDDKKLPSITDNMKRAALVLLALAVIAGGIWLYVRHRKPKEPDAVTDRTWAEEELRRLERLGRDHGFRRRSATSVIHYVDGLARELDDGEPRLWGVAEIIDDGLYGHRQLSVEERLRVSATIDQVIAEHPKPSRAERRKKEKAGV